MLTFNPQFLRSVAIEAEAIPFPSELKTPPVIKIYLVSDIIIPINFLIVNYNFFYVINYLIRKF